MDENMKRVAFFTISMRFGGAERVISNLLKHFSKEKNIKLYLILLEEKINYDVPDNVTIINFHRELGKSYAKFFSLIFDSFRLAKIVKKEKINIVISFLERPNITNVLSGWLGVRHKVIVSVRNMLIAAYNNRSRIERMIMQTLDRVILKKADLIVTNSSAIKEELISNFGVPKDKLKVIYNALDIEFIKREASETVDFPWFKEKAPIIINVGRLESAKGQEYLIRAFSRVIKKRDARLLIIGNGKLRTSLEELTHNLNLDDSVLFLDFEKNPFKYLSHSTIFVLSSLWEGFPNVLLEAMTCGLPVISTYYGPGVIEILGFDEQHKFNQNGIKYGKYGILVSKKDEIKLADAILALLTDGKLLKTYKKRSMEAINEFAIDIIANEWRKLF